MSRLKLFLFNTFILTLTSLFMSAIGFFFNVYVANKIGSEGAGIFELMMSIYSFAITFANSGISLSATRIVAEELDMYGARGLKKAMAKCIIYSLCFGLLATSLLCVFSSYISKVLLHDKVSSFPIYIMAISMPFSSVLASLSGYFTGVRHVSKTSACKVLSMILQVILTCTFLYVFRSNNLSIVCTYLILASTISSIFEFILTYILYLNDSKKYNFRNAGNNYWWKILRIAMPVAITSYIRSGLSTFKEMIVPYSLEKHTPSCDTALSQYGLINGMTMPILMFPCIIITSCASLLIPEFARYNSKKDFKRMNEVISIIFKFTSIFSVCIIGVFIFFSNEISILLYKNTSIAVFLLMLAPLVILIYLDKIVDSMLRGLDKQVGVMICNIFDLIITISLITFLVPKLGIYGYIIVITISELFNFIVSLIQLYSVTHFKFSFTRYVVLPLLVLFILKYIL